MEDLFNPNDLAPGAPGYFVPAAGANDEFRTVPATERAEGIDTTFLLERMRGQARLTFAHNKLATIRDFSHFRSLLDAAVARGNENPTFIADAQRILAANDGVEQVTGSRSSEYSASWTIDYQFPRGSWLKGTRFAVHGNWRDKYNLTLLNGVMYRGGATYPVVGDAIHQRRLFARPTSYSG